MLVQNRTEAKPKTTIKRNSDDTDFARVLRSAAEEPRQAGDVLRVLDPTDPMSIARMHTHELYSVGGGVPIMHRHRHAFYLWSEQLNRYIELDEADVRAELYKYLEESRKEAKAEGHRDTVPFKPTQANVNNAMDAMRAVCHLSSAIEPPAWLANKEMMPAHEILAHQGGLLHLPSGSEVAPTPSFFSTHSVDFEYNPDFGEPVHWLAFLGQLWPDDDDAVNLLQEWMGYLLTADTRQQKILLLVGPKRSGKGTIARVIAGLLGRDAVCGPTLASLGESFGLAPLLHKRAAIISDARLSGRSDQAAIAERLLSISGEDAVTVNIKHQPAVTAHLPTRFMVLTNELPRLADASGALASRFMVLTLAESFYGREDHNLTDRLMAELPVILNWAIEGWKRLRARGRFVQPASSAEAISELEDLGSPIGAFIRDKCIVAPGKSVEAKRLYEAWRGWCEAEGRDHPGTMQTFGRDLRAAVPGLRVSVPRAMGTRIRFYEGITLDE